ncbi:MAG: 4-(cytidine 5'-diphospho)-2-C-methyl-D-erythritol kinase [Opitutales bacterium]
MSLHPAVTVFSPAKINLFLAVTGRRTDGFHDLVSVAAPVEFGDELVAELVTENPPAHKATARQAEDREQKTEDREQRTEEGGQFTLECDAPGVPADGSNLVLQAAQSYAAATGWTGRVHFRLTKRIPPGAGLGGGSSNAVAALRALERLTGGRAGPTRLAELAAGLGSDCALFLPGTPVVMRGRGERVEPLAAPAAERLHGQRVLIFKPGFGVGTPWAYGRMAARGTDYLPAARAEERLDAWVQGPAPVAELLINNMEPAVFAKHVALPALLGRLRTEFGVATGMSGSGSACFALLGDRAAAPLAAAVRAAWGPPAFLQETRLAPAPAGPACTSS